MFLVMGIYEHSKEIEYKGKMEICPDCGRYCNYKVFMNYMCFSLFFIPLIKWNKRYYAISTCCGKKHELGNVTEEDIKSQQ